MMEPFSYNLWLIFATSLVVSIVFTVPSSKAQKQDLTTDSGRSSCLHEGHDLRNFSFVGKAIFAGCFCKQTEFDILMCAAWQLLPKQYIKNSQIKVFQAFDIGQGRVQSNDSTEGSCSKYAENIIDRLYGNDQLNYSTVQKASLYSTNWTFCEDMRVKNNMGCNYTIVPARGLNGSLGTNVHYFVRSFTNASQHLRLGDFYQVEIEQCKGSILNIGVSVLKDPSYQPKTTSGEFFPFPRRTLRGHRTTLHTKAAPDNDQNKQNTGIVLSDNDALCIATILAAMLAFF